jgi:twitching motility protein PilT
VIFDPLFAQVFDEALRLEVSDIHLKNDSYPIFRVHGKLEKISSLPFFKDEELRKIILQLLTPDQQKRMFIELGLDFGFTYEGKSRCRANIYFSRGTIGIALRILPMNPYSWEELSLPDVIEKIRNFRQGLVLVTGPTGSGKSTTMAAMIDDFNTLKSLNIVTVEDPIEYVFTDKKSNIIQREVGLDVRSFPEALRYSLREDPDVIFIGEMRDQETINSSFLAAETGHLVLSTLHTNNSYSTVDRIVNTFPADQQHFVRLRLSETLKVVLSQTLLPTVDNKGRVVACEVMVVTPHIKDLIAEARLDDIYSDIKNGQYNSMSTLNQALFKLFQDRKIDRTTAVNASYKPSELEQMLKGVYNSADAFEEITGARNSQKGGDNLH